MSDERSEQSDLPDLYPRQRAYESVRAVLADVQENEGGVTGARNIADRVLAESGVDGLVEVAVELALKLAASLERIAGDQGIAAVDLAVNWLAD